MNKLIIPNPDIILPDRGSGYRPGQVLIANDSRFLETHFSEPLTAYAVGWRDPSNLEATLEFFAPAVPVGRRFEWKKASNAAEFYSETFDDERAIGADFKRVEYPGTDVTDKTLNKGLTYIADLDNETGNWRQVKTAKLMRRLVRNDLRRAITGLSGAATNTAKTWDTTAGKDPDMDVLTDLVTAANSTGIRPNRIGYGDTAWSKRLLAHRAQDSAGGMASAALTPPQLAGFLAVDQVLVSSERYTSSSTAKTGIVANLVLMFYAQGGVDTEDASNIKRFVSSVDGGGYVRVYEQQISAKLVAITVEHYSKIVITYSSGIRQFTIS